MHRLILATLMLGVLGCGSGEESRPKASSEQRKSASSAAHAGESDVGKLIADGRRLFDKKKYPAAIEAFSKAIQLDDQSAIAYRERAQARMFAAGHDELVPWVSNRRITRIGHKANKLERVVFEKALADLAEAIRLDASDVEAYKLQGRCFAELGNSNRSIAAFGEAIRLAPQDADAYHKRGLGYAQSNEFTMADADFTRAIELDPKMFKSLVVRGSLRRMNGDTAGALADFDNVIQQDETHANAYINRSQVYVQMREFGKAAADCTRAIELEPNQATAYTSRGGAYLGLKESSKAIALDPNDQVSYMNRAMAYKNTGLFSKALADVDASIELASDFALMYRRRAGLLAKLGSPEEARAARRKAEWVEQFVSLNRTVMNSPKNSKGYQRRAVHYADDEQWEDAISDFNKVLQLEPESTDALVGRAKAWLAQGKIQKAIDDCMRALKHSTHREIYSVRGDAYLELGDHNRAIADYERAKRFDTQVAQAFLLRSKERKAAGETSAADKDLQHAILIDPSLSGLR